MGGMHEACLVKSHRDENMSGLGRNAYLIGATPLFYLFLPNYLVGHISLDYKAYLGALALSLFAALAAYQGLKRWDGRAGLLHEGVSEIQRFGSFSGIALALGSLLFAVLIAVNSVNVLPTSNEETSRPQFRDPQAGEFCPVNLRGVSLLCVLTLHSPNPSVFIGGG